MGLHDPQGRSRTLRRAPALPARLVVLFTAMLAVGCECTVEDMDRLYSEDWDACDALCGWQLLSGTATVVDTFHSAERALQLMGSPAAVRHDVDVGSRTCGDGPCTWQIGVVTSCADSLAVRLVYRDLAGSELASAVTMECSSAGGSLDYCVGSAPLGQADSDGGAGWPLVGLVISSTEDGCIVDDVILQSFYLFCGA